MPVVCCEAISAGIHQANGLPGRATRLISLNIRTPPHLHVEVEAVKPQAAAPEEVAAAPVAAEVVVVVAAVEVAAEVVVEVGLILHYYLPLQRLLQERLCQ